MSRPPLTLVGGGAQVPGIGAALELGVLGVALTLVVSWMAQLPGAFHDLGRFQLLYLVAFALYALAVLRLGRWAALPHVGWAVLAVTLATRAAFLAAPPSLSGDLFRYVWEGKVLAHGFDPYRLSPADPALAALRDPAIHPYINHPALAAIYPPLALAGYAAVAAISPSVLALKLWCVMNEIALVVVLLAWMKRRGTSPAQVLVYAWNPLVIVEFAGSAHNDPAGMLWLALALMWAERRPIASAWALAAGVLTKLAPLMAVPFLILRYPWRARAIAFVSLAAGLGAYIVWTRHPASGLAEYGGAWRNNELAFHYLALWTGSDAAARVIAAAAVAAVIGFALARGTVPERATQLGFRTALLLSPVFHPWYLGWTLMFEPLKPSWPWLILSLTMILNYGVFQTPAAGRSFHLSLTWRWIEYGIPLAVAIAMFLARRAPPRRRLRSVASAA